MFKARLTVACLPGRVVVLATGKGLGDFWSIALEAADEIGGGGARRRVYIIISTTTIPYFAMLG